MTQPEQVHHELYKQGKSSRLRQVEPSEDGIARAFIELFGNDFRYDHTESAWFHWNGDCWAKDTTLKIFDIIRELCCVASEHLSAAERKALRRSSFVNGVEKLARSDQTVAITKDAWDSKPMLLGCPGATIDLATGETRPPDRNDHITRLCSIAPRAFENPSATYWYKFYNDVTGGNIEMAEFAQRFFGYSLTTETKEHAMLFIYGPGGNGKSLLVNTIRKVLGDYAITAPMETFTSSKRAGHPADLAMMAGARFVVASETEEGHAWNESRIKSMTGGDPITARFMRANFFTFLPQFKLAMVGNHQPTLQNVDDAMRRRILMVPFNSKPETVDLDLEAKLESELPGILDWLIQGALEWSKKGLLPPPAIVGATNEYFEEQDVFGQFLDQHCRLEASKKWSFVTSADLYREWKSFAEDAGEDPKTQKFVGSRLRRIGLTTKQKNIGGKNCRVWEGIALLHR
ncbi:phage/plasmid primase, P4 family [uncultured Roseobacter sp.]|uniref:phage/plasmid primase, P4 family n=1 Tax=uncultured Roseobacter sp. TaxID=114847 RepID=UPI002624EB4C|nr:phage/plasmid primase, P4 family [uncultured Roseobacter sp.]